jgi:hypothetical protein
LSYLEAGVSDTGAGLAVTPTNSLGGIETAYEVTEGNALAGVTPHRLGSTRHTAPFVLPRMVA